MAGAFEGGIVVVVEVVEAEDAVATALKSGGDVGADEARGAGDEDREAAIVADAGGGADPFFPGGSAPGVGTEGAAGEI